MKTNYTPGPWKVIEAFNQMSFPETTVCDISYSGQTNYFITSESENHGDAEATARLIAAAPEMLQALKRFIVFADRINSLHNDGFESSMIRQAKAAIAKATGEKEQQL